MKHIFLRVRYFLGGILGVLIVLAGGCSVTIPPDVEPVKPFDANRYLGQWYEIARLDHSFERGLECVSATYTFSGAGKISVQNKGYHLASEKWKEAIGKAYFTREKDEGALSVSFFGPFYGGYNVVALDMENYRWALVQGSTKSYFWILSREKNISGALKNKLLNEAKHLGIDIERLLWINQSCRP